MNCEACQALLLDYEAEILDAAKRAEVAQHLLACATCRAQLDQVRLARAHLSMWPDQEPAPDLSARTLDALDRHIDGRRSRVVPDEAIYPSRPAKPPRKLFRPMLTPVAACALVACLGYYAHLANLQVRLGAEVYGAETLTPEAMSLVRLSLFHVEDRDPMPGKPVTVSLRDRDGKETELFRGTSDAHGQVSARLQVPKLPDGQYQLVVKALDGEDAATLIRAVTVHRSHRVLLSTDKPLYQPGQTIHARALAFDATTHKPAREASLTFSAYDPKGSRIFKKTVAVDAYGVASFDLPLADQLNLGSYKISAEVGDSRSEADVQVARYSLPKFDLQVVLDQPWVRPGHPVTGQLKARYFFGKPVAHAVVKLGAGVFIDGFREVAQTSVNTDADGLARFSLDLPSALPGTSLAEGNAVVQLAATARDAADETVEKHAEVIVAEQELTLSAIPENGTLASDVENKLLVLVARPDGQPVARAQVTLDGTGKVATTGDDGVAALDFLPRHLGRRDVSLTAIAPDGARVTRTVELAAKPSFALIRTEKSLYAAGETLRGTVVATSALRVAYLDVIAEGRTVMTQTVDLDRGQGAFAFELPAELSGAISLEAYAQNGGELQRTRRIVYAQDPRGLKVDVAVERASYKPGETAKLRFHVADEKGNPTAAGLGLSVVDESVFALASKDPAMLRAFLTLAEELRKPRFSLDASRIVTGGSAQQAADLIFSATELQPTVTELARTDAQQLSVRRAALASFKDKRTGTVWFAGAFMLMLMLEGVLRMAAERFLEFLLQKRFGWLLLGSGVVFVFVDLMGGDVTDAIGLSLATLTLGSAMFACFKDGELDGNRVLLVCGLAGTLLFGLSIFGDNIRKMFGASVDALAGDASMNTGARPERRPMQHRNVLNFAGYATMDEGFAEPARPQVVDAPASPPAEDAADRFREEKPAPEPKLDRQSKGGEAGAAPLSRAEKAQVRVRSYFPETLFWAPEVVTDAHGDATVEVPAADSITTWRAAVTATSADGRFGTGQAALKVFQDFFVDLELPPVLTVGDEVEIPIAVHNYLDQPETLTLEVEPADWLQSSAPRDYKLALKPGEVAGIKYRFTATRFGKSLPLTVYAVGPHGKDAIRREVEVRPAGVPFDLVANGEASRGGVARLALPPDAVAGASHAELRLYPSTFAAVMDGLDNVLRMPSGCFEQTSSTTYPNALVLRYLRDNKKGTPELLARGEGYLTTGYQRLLSFEVQGGGFEWFGRAPANQVLTAYGLLEFGDMAKVFPVDEQVIARTQEFLAARQGYDGSWPVDSQNLADGLYRESFRGTLTTTAYVTWALAESGYRGTATDRAVRYLSGRVDGSTDTYSLALALNAMLLLDPPRADSALGVLMERASEGPNGTLSFPAGGSTLTYARGSDADVETTALAASALLRAGRTAQAVKALKWLLSVRDPHGTWNSTQATVLALRVLLQAASTPGLSESRGTLRISSNGRSQTVAFTADQADVVKRVDLTSWLGSGPLELSFDGDAQASYQLELSGYRPRTAEDRPALSLELGYDRASLKVDDTVQARLTARYQRSEASGMVLIQAAIPPGFDPVTADLERLVSARQIAKYSSDGRQLTFYVDRLREGEPLELTYGLHARYAVRATAPASSAYLYYAPAVHAESKALPLTVAGN